MFDSDKVMNVILYIITHLKRTDMHKVFKILYFSDREFLYKYGHTITGDSYIAMEAGPVPSKIYDICKIIRGDSYTKDTNNLSRYFRIESWMYLHAILQPDMDYIALSEKEVIDFCIRTYGDLSYDEIKEKSHDIAWRSTARDYPISLENIARESGMNDDEVAYISEMNALQIKFS